MHQIDELLEQEEKLRGCTNASADHDAIERVCAQRLRECGLSRLAQVNQA